jgi:hypothetical protein
MRQFEYQRKWCAVSEFDSKLNGWGLKGWEAVLSRNVASNPIKDRVYILMKRELNQVVPEELPEDDAR